MSGNPTRPPKILNVGRIRSSEPWSSYPHSHNFEEFVVVLSGTLFFDAGGASQTVPAGTVLAFQRGEKHCETSREGHPVDLIYIQCNADIPSKPAPIHDHGSRMRHLAYCLLDDFRTSSPRKDEILGAYLQSFLEEYRRANTRGTVLTSQRARCLQREDLSRRITISHLAREFGLSPALLARRYREETGSSPIQDLRMVRLQAAHDLISSTNLPLRTVADMTGFSDLYHLSHALKTYLRVSANKLRRDASKEVATAG
jgi:AraC-like DNA-binding protein